MTKRSWTALDSLRAALGLEPPGDIDQRTRPKVLAPPDEEPLADEKPRGKSTPDAAAGTGKIQPRTPTAHELLIRAIR